MMKTSLPAGPALSRDQSARHGHSATGRSADARELVERSGLDWAQVLLAIDDLSASGQSLVGTRAGCAVSVALSEASA